MNLETKIIIYKFTPQVFTLTPSGTALEETLITKRNLPISSVFWVSNMEISLPSSPNSA